MFESPVSVIGVSNTFPFGSTKLVIAFCCPSFTYVIGVSWPGVVGTGGTLYPFSGWFGSTGVNGTSGFSGLTGFVGSLGTTGVCPGTCGITGTFGLFGSFGSCGFSGFGVTTLLGSCGSLSYGVGVRGVFGVTPSGTFGTNEPTLV